MKRILIGYDGWSCARKVLEDLKRLRFPKNSEALVISVAEVWLPRDSKKSKTEKLTRLSKVVRRAHEVAPHAVETHAMGLAEEAVGTLRQAFPAWKVKATAAGDSAAWGILNQAATWEADLIVLGSHRRSAIETVFLGSVSHKVANEAHCSMHIAGPRLKAHHRSRGLSSICKVFATQTSRQACGNRVESITRDRNAHT